MMERLQTPINISFALLKNIGSLAIYVGTIGCFIDQVQAATFKASIDEFSLVMPAAIENKFGFTLSTGNFDGDKNFIGNANANYQTGQFSQTLQPSELPTPPFSSVRVGREGLVGIAEGFANPSGHADANAQAVIFGRLGNGTGLEGFPPLEDIPLSFDLSFKYSLSALVNDPALESAAAGFEVSVNGFGTPDPACGPLSLTITANDVRSDTVTCTFSTTLAGSEFRDFDIQMKVFGVADAVEPPNIPPPPELPVPPDISTPVPEPATLLGTATALGFGSFLKRKRSKTQNKSKQKD